MPKTVPYEKVNGEDSTKGESGKRRRKKEEKKNTEWIGKVQIPSAKEKGKRRWTEINPVGGRVGFEVGREKIKFWARVYNVKREAGAQPTSRRQLINGQEGAGIQLPGRGHR